MSGSALNLLSICAPSITWKSKLSTRPNKAILVAGTNIQELKNVLDATKDKNIDVYTHGEMIVAYTYPKFGEYENLVGQFGKGIENCLLDFATFPGAILIARHSLENIEYLYIVGGYKFVRSCLQ